MRNLGRLTRLWRREFWVNLVKNSRLFVNFWRNLGENSRKIVIASGFLKPRSNPQSKIRIHAVIARRGTRRSNPLRDKGAFLDTNSHFLSTNSRPKNALRALMDCFEFATQILAMTGRGENSRKFQRNSLNLNATLPNFKANSWHSVDCHDFAYLRSQSLAMTHYCDFRATYEKRVNFSPKRHPKR